MYFLRLPFLDNSLHPRYNILMSISKKVKGRMYTYLENISNTVSCFLRILWGFDYRKLKYAPKVLVQEQLWKFQTTNWIMDEWRRVKLRVVGGWIVSGGRLIQGTYIVKFSNYHPSWKCGITTCQDTCTKRGLNVMIWIRKFFSKWRSWCNDVSFFDVLNSIHDIGYIAWKVSERWSGYFISPFWKKNINKRGISLVLILMWVVKDTIFTCRV